MKQYLVYVSGNLPYPITKEYRLDASNIATASQRAIKQFRKDKKGKRIDELTIKVKFAGKGLKYENSEEPK